MRVLLLSPYPTLIQAPIIAAGDELIVSNEPPGAIDFDVDLIMSFGYRHIIKPPLLTALACPILNLHISFLPWNRGADPNFWSWFDDTPKGVSIHHIAAGIDTGDIVVQREVAFDADSETLATSFEKLRLTGCALFAESWPAIRAGDLPDKPQQATGSYHRVKDREPWWPRLPNGFDTPVRFVEAMGAAARTRR
jgi:methionyl-tRNA formyltransferase